MQKKQIIEWRKATTEEIENGSDEMIKEKDFFIYIDSHGNNITEEQYKKETTTIKKVLRKLKIIV